MLSRKLLSLLISLLLMLSPFASLDVAAAIAGEGHCMRMDMGVDASGTVDSYFALSAGDHSMPDCAHCKDDSCGDSSCASHGCSAGSLSLINTDELSMQDYKSLRQFANSNTDLFSHNTPPLLRPPV